MDDLHSGNFTQIFVKDCKDVAFIGLCWPGLSGWIDYFNENAREYWKSLYSYENFVGTTNIHKSCKRRWWLEEEKDAIKSSGKPSRQCYKYYKTAKALQKILLQHVAVTSAAVDGSITAKQVYSLIIKTGWMRCVSEEIDNRYLNFILPHICYR